MQLPLDRQATTTPATRAERGQEVREQITGADRTERMYASAADDELHFQRFLRTTPSQYRQTFSS